MTKNIQSIIKEIQERNKKVEADKAWETSLTRRLIIGISTYIIMGFFLISINAPNPWLNAFVPAGAYVLSTLTLPVIKKWWMKNYNKK